MKLPKYYVIVCLLFLLSKARQAKRKFKVKKITKPKWQKNQNEVTKICNEPGINLVKTYHVLLLQCLWSLVVEWNAKGVHHPLDYAWECPVFGLVAISLATRNDEKSRSWNAERGNKTVKKCPTYVYAKSPNKSKKISPHKYVIHVKYRGAI